MTSTRPQAILSRIDKLLLDKSATHPQDAHLRRIARVVRILIGTDVATSRDLQLMLFTAVNLGVKCFGRATVHADPHLWLAPCLTKVTVAATLADAVTALGGNLEPYDATGPNDPHLVLGDTPTTTASLRVTFDGWVAASGPAIDLPRMDERPYCPLACIAAAAIGIGELFSAFAGINVMATRQVVRLSLWGADASTPGGYAVGLPIEELPAELSVFGLGHLGQAYLWSLVALPYAQPQDACFWLCDDDLVEKPNIETGALLTPDDIDSLKTRAIAKWLEDRGFSTRLLERRVDEGFRRTEREPVIALSGFDDNRPRRWLAGAGFERIFDSGLGGEVHNFDTIAFRSWPNLRLAEDLWPFEIDIERQAREVRKRAVVEANQGYRGLADDECGRLNLAGQAIAVPFVGAIAASIVVAEALKSVNGIAHFSELKLRACLLGSIAPIGRIDSDLAPIRGLVAVPAKA